MFPQRRSRYGPAVLGQAEFDRQKLIAEKTRSGTYGPAVTGPIEEEEIPPVELDPGATPADAGLSISQLGKLLAEEPHMLDRQIEAEMLRAGGPRKGALRLFLEYEDRRDDGPRAHVLKALKHVLEGD